jgi:hypothetical protein
MAEIHVPAVIQTYELHLYSKPYVFSTTVSRATLGAKGVPNQVSLAFIFSDPDVGV